MPMMRPICLALLLAGCASHQAHEVQAWAAGRSLAELEQCAGKPSVTDALADGSAIAQWDYAEPAGSTSLPLPIAAAAGIAEAALGPVAMLASLAGAGNASASFSNAGACHAIATVRGGVVVRLRYAGPNGGLSGPDAVCAPIMRECLTP